MPRGILQISDVSLSYWEQGTGPNTLLLLHGSNQSLATFSDQLASPLLSTFRLLALDLPGHGLSSPTADPSMLGLASLVAEFARQKISSPFVVVGFSLGGHIALGLVACGLRPRGLVLMATPPAAKPINMAEMFHAAGPMGLLYKHPLDPGEAHALARAFYHKDAPLSQELEDIARVHPTFKQRFPLSLIEGRHIDEQELLASLELPVLVMTAEHDSFVQNHQILKRLPRNGVHRNYSTGHNIHREAADQFTADLAAFAHQVC